MDSQANCMTLLSAASAVGKTLQRLSKPCRTREIDYAITHGASCLVCACLEKREYFPQKREAWYQPSGEDVPK